MSPADSPEPPPELTGDRATQPLSLRVNFSWMFAGKLVFAACKWAVLIALAKLVTPDLVGHYALGLAITNPVILLTNLSLRAVLATDAQDEHPFAVFLGLRLATIALAFVVISVIVLLARFPIDKGLVVLMVGLTKCVESVSDVLYGLFQKRERMDRIGRSFMLRGVGSVVTMVVAVVLTREVFWGLAAMAGAWLLVLLVYDIPQAVVLRSSATGGPASLRPDFRWRAMVDLARLALPLAIVAVLLTLNQSIPRLVLESSIGEAELGIFAALAYLLVPGGMIANSMGQATIPRLSQYWASRDWGGFRRVLGKTLGISAFFGVAGVAVALVLGEWLLDLVYAPEYAAHADVFTLIMAAGIFFYVGTVLGCAIAATRQFTRFVAPYLGWAAATLVLSLLLIPPYGLMGAAWATVGISIAGCATPMIVLMTARRSR